MPVSYIPIDERLSRAVLLRFKHPTFGDRNVEFQFPPKITSDSRKGTWDEGEMRGFEPISTFRLSGPREMSLTWVYIVDNAELELQGWTTRRISENVRRLRGYFALVRSAGDYRNLVVEFKMWRIGGPEPMSCRIKSVDIKHSDTIMVPRGIVREAYPLRTDVTVDLRMWTKGRNNGEIVQDVDGLLPREPPEWY